MQLDKQHLINKAVLFKMPSASIAYAAKVHSVEIDGFWFDSPTLFAELSKGSNVAGTKKPLLFVPTSHLSWLMVFAEESE